MAPASFSDLPQEIKNEIYEAAIPKRFVQGMFHWRIHRPQSTKHRRQGYHPNSNTVRKLPAVAKAFDDARDFFLNWHQEVSMPVKSYHFVGGPNPLETDLYEGPVWFSHRTDVLSLSELADCDRSELDWVLGIKNGPAKLLDDKRCTIAFNRDFLGERNLMSRPFRVNKRTKYMITKELLQRVADHEEWVFVVGKVRIQLPQNQETRRRFGEEEDTFLVDVDDQDMIDWLITSIQSYEDPSARLLNGHGTMWGAARDLWMYSAKGQRDLQQRYGIMLDVEETKKIDRRRVQQAWLEANDFLQPVGPIEWVKADGTFGRTKSDLINCREKVWDRRDPFVRECADKMPKVRYRIKVDLLRQDRWELRPFITLRIQEQNEAEDDEVKKSAAKEVRDPLFYPESNSTSGTTLDQWGQMDRKRTSQEQRHRKEKSRKRENEKRRRRGHEDRRKEPTQHTRLVGPHIWIGGDVNEILVSDVLEWTDRYELRRRERVW